MATQIHTGKNASQVKGQPDMFTRNNTAAYGQRPLCTPTSEVLCDASEIAIDSAGNLFVSDLSDDRVVIF